MAIDIRLVEETAQYPRPFLKWVGGKRQLLPDLRRRFPAFEGRYHEPFLGGGAVFFDLGPGRATLSDCNEELIDCFCAIRDHADEVILQLRKHIYEREHYYETRAVDPEGLTKIQRAARMIYLNKAGFNGLYRVNSRGEFNVPFGRHKNPNICDEGNILACAQVLRGATIICRPFERVKRTARPGDFVYFDPPYIPLSATSSFTSYHRSGFGMYDQELLARVFESLDKKGVHVMLSNSDVPWIHERFKGFKISRIKARRNVNSVSARRGFVGEVVVTNS